MHETHRSSGLQAAAGLLELMAGAPWAPPAAAVMLPNWPHGGGTRKTIQMTPIHPGGASLTPEVDVRMLIL